MLDLHGKKALVTGGARGIGLGCAIELARAGAEVAINDLELSPAATDAVNQINELGRPAHFVPGDAFARGSCERIVQGALEALQRIDILISNPAYTHRASFLEFSPEEFDRSLQGTLHGNFHMSQLVARHMVFCGEGGKIVFISSVQARIPFGDCVAYNAGKAGLVHMAATIANELAPHRINVNVIEPGWIETPGEREHFGMEYIQAEGPKLPWGRLGTPQDIGKAAVFLSSADADYITATSLLVDGGFWLRSAR